jgi:two-component system response regulator DevR
MKIANCVHASGGAEFVSFHCRKRRLVLLQPDPDESATLLQMLEHSNAWDLQAHLSPDSALQSIRALTPDAVLLDGSVAQANAIPVAEKLRSISPDLPVLLLLDYTEPTTVLRAVMAGVSGFLLRPVLPQGLLDALNNAALRLPSLPVEAQTALLAALNRTPPVGLFPLSRREHQVILLFAQGEAYKEIASKFGVSVGTVHAQVASAYQKLGVHSRGEAFSKLLGLC